NMPTGATRRPRLADAIIEEIAIDILRGDIPQGALLAPEPQLSERFRVSRTVVREAVKRLQSLGLIDVRHGIGTIVLGPEQWDDFDPDLIRIRASAGLIGDLADDLFAIRRMIEVQVAADAARHRTGEQLSTLATIVDRMREKRGDPAAYTDLDIDYHNLLLAAGGNTLLAKMMQPVNQIRRIGSLITSASQPRVIPDSIAGHEAIYAAIEASDADLARQLMADHLDEFARDLIDGLSSNDT
ncbi:MAG: FadR/GntR family transcriptional regulator, partial [Thermomicrobiales bacterium]